MIRVVLTSLLRRKLGASAGDYFKLLVNNTLTGQGFYFRCQVMHSLKVAPGVDLFRSYAYMSEQQAHYIFQAIGYDPQQLHYNKLFVRRQAASGEHAASGLQEVGNRILSMSPDHTEVVEIS